MPGARIFRIVVTKLTPLSKVPMPEICSDHKIVVDADAGRELQLAERRVGDPAGLRELTDERARR